MFCNKVILSLSMNIKRPFVPRLSAGAIPCYMHLLSAWDAKHCLHLRSHPPNHKIHSRVSTDNDEKDFWRVSVSHSHNAWLKLLQIPKLGGDTLSSHNSMMARDDSSGRSQVHSHCCLWHTFSSQCILFLITSTLAEASHWDGEDAESLKHITPFPKLQVGSIILIYEHISSVPATLGPSRTSPLWPEKGLPYLCVIEFTAKFTVYSALSIALEHMFESHALKLDSEPLIANESVMKYCSARRPCQHWLVFPSSQLMLFD